MFNRAWPLVVVLVSLSACEGEIQPAPVSFRRDIAPLFQANCTPCHWSPLIGSGRVVDVTRVSDLVGAPSIWDGGLPYLVIPGKPDESFLLDKISRTEFGPREGNTMPYSYPLLSNEELGKVRAWILNGARPDDPLFDPARSDGGAPPGTPVSLIFGKAINQGPSIGKCSLCHGPNTPNPPVLSAPFDANGELTTVGANGEPVIVPGKPEASRLYQKLLDPPPSGAGRVMPLQLGRLDEQQIGLVRRWILEGAKDN